MIIDEAIMVCMWKQGTLDCCLQAPDLVLSSLCTLRLDILHMFHQLLMVLPLSFMYVVDSVGSQRSLFCRL